MVEVSSANREEDRNRLCELADDIRHRENMTVPEVRDYLKQLLDVSI